MGWRQAVGCRTVRNIFCVDSLIFMNVSSQAGQELVMRKFADDLYAYASDTAVMTTACLRLREGQTWARRRTDCSSFWRSTSRIFSSELLHTRYLQ